MSEAENLSTCFEKLRDERLPSLGMEDSQSIRIISARLLIERVGERDANYWWDSRVLSDFGQDTLRETVPRTATRSRVELAMKVGRKVESEMIDEDSVSLFDFGPFVEDQIKREIDKIDNNKTLDILEDQSVEITEVGWTGSLTDETVMKSSAGTSYRIGSISADDLQNKNTLRSVVSELISGYGSSTRQNLQIPYYTLK